MFSSLLQIFCQQLRICREWAHPNCGMSTPSRYGDDNDLTTWGVLGGITPTTEPDPCHLNLTELPPLEIAELISIIIFCIFMIFAAIGNILVLVTIYHRRKLHRPSYFLLANLAAGDLSCNLFVMSLYESTAIMRRWVFGTVICQYQAFAVMMLAFQSLTTLSCVSVDRYMAICQPLTYHLRVTPRGVCVVVVLSWLYPTLISLPPLCGWGHYELDLYLYGCHTVWARDYNNSSYVQFLGISFFGLSTIIVTCYVLIYRASRRLYSSDPPPGLNHSSSQKMKHELRAALMFFVLICSFVLSWCPFVAVRMYRNYKDPTVTGRLAERVTLFLFQLGSLFNPYIYAILSREFKQEMKYLFRRRGNSVSG